MATASGFWYSPKSITKLDQAHLTKFKVHFTLVIRDGERLSLQAKVYEENKAKSLNLLQSRVYWVSNTEEDILNTGVLKIYQFLSKEQANEAIYAYGNGNLWHIEQCLIDHDFNDPIATYIRFKRYDRVRDRLVEKPKSTVYQTLGYGYLYIHRTPLARNFIEYSDSASTTEPTIQLLSKNTVGSAAFDVTFTSIAPEGVMIPSGESFYMNVHKVVMHPECVWLLRSRYMKINVSSSTLYNPEQHLLTVEIVNNSKVEVLLMQPFMQVMVPSYPIVTVSKSIPITIEINERTNHHTS